ncbi:MAG: YggS family pyridoxal phosphate-dependent enzyme [Ignavibacteriae bacterium]|nr:YggS family pyridoxal phosphate-dependent enzyme [Ignavibacteriota bacterium]
MSLLKKNIDEVTERIKQKCLDSDRNISEITLVTVSKLNHVEAIKEAVALGLSDFGENKAQELKQKFDQFSGNINWHFIGHLQSNKVKDVVPLCHLIHSVDSIKLANEINKRAANNEKIQKILLEVKTSDEESKYGIQNFEELLKLTEHCESLSNIKLLGLMTMAPYTDDESVIRKSFKKLAKFKDDLENKGFPLEHLSMGMTSDFEIAIEEGATILRIGTAIFGERDYKRNNN